MTCQRILILNVLEVSRLKKHISIGCVIFLSAIANALFFLPVIPTLGQNGQKGWDVLYEKAFFIPATQKLFSVKEQIRWGLFGL